MEKKRFIYVAVMGLIWALVISGCASHGRLRVQSRSGIAAAVEDIKENYDKFVIHANEWPAGEVSAIVFDPKGDNRTIENDGWTKVTSREAPAIRPDVHGAQPARPFHTFPSALR